MSKETLTHLQTNMQQPLERKNQEQCTAPDMQLLAESGIQSIPRRVHILDHLWQFFQGLLLKLVLL